jgi:competence protein ComFC
MGIVTRLLDALFPYIPACVGCGAEKGAVDSLCPKCAEELGELEAGSAEAPCFPAYSLYWYDGLAARIVRGYKYEDKRWLSRFMGGRLACAARCIGRFDAVCSVPLHKKRRRKRGFDQAELLARRIAEELRIPFVRGAQRTRNTPTQTKLNRQQRQENVRDAFAPAKPVSGRVLLVDDVLTTGATAAACAQALIKAGAGSVFLLTFAHAKEAGGGFTDAKRG